MPRFRYKARGANGNLLEGELDGASAAAVAAQLASGGATPVSITERAATEPKLATVLDSLGKRPPGLDELTLFCRQMHTLLRSGVPIVRGIRGLRDSSRNPRMTQVLDGIAADLESGRDLSSSMAGYSDVFSTLFQSMVRVGENTGRLDEAFRRIGQHLDLEGRTRERIKTALRYPAFVIVAIGIAVGVINVFVIPAFAKVFERGDLELPWATQVLIAVSDLSVRFWPGLLGALVVSILAWRRYISTEKGRYRWDKVKLRLPVVGDIILRSTLGRFSRTFAMTARSGVPLIQALNVVSRSLDNEFVGERVLQMREGVERGDNLTRTAAATGLFTPLVLQMISVGEETGALDDLLEEVADFYEREVDHDLANLSSNIEPILIVAVGVLVLMLAMGVFLPMWDLAAGVGLRD